MPETWCGKQKHKTHNKARRAMQNALRTAGRRHRKNKRRGGLKGNSHYKGSGAKVAVYQCPICSFWHWGHSR